MIIIFVIYFYTLWKSDTSIVRKTADIGIFTNQLVEIRKKRNIAFSVIPVLIIICCLFETSVPLIVLVNS